MRRTHSNSQTWQIRNDCVNCCGGETFVKHKICLFLDRSRNHCTVRMWLSGDSMGVICRHARSGNIEIFRTLLVLTIVASIYSLNSLSLLIACTKTAARGSDRRGCLNVVSSACFEISVCWGFWIDAQMAISLCQHLAAWSISTLLWQIMEHVLPFEDISISQV